MTKYVESWGADKPFANITETTLAKNIGLTVSTSARTFLKPKKDLRNFQVPNLYPVLEFLFQSLAMIETNLLPNSTTCFDCSTYRWNNEDLNPLLLWFRDKSLETAYRAQPDYDYRYYVTAACILLAAMALTQFITIPG